MTENAIVVPEQATFWSAYLIWPDREERLSFKETSRSPRETRHPISELVKDGAINFEELVERYGEGSFRLQFYGTDAEGRFSSLGKTAVFVLGDATHEPEEEEQDPDDESPDSEESPETDVATTPRFVMPPLQPLADPVGSAPPSVGIGATPPPSAPLPSVGAFPPIPVPATDPLAASLALFQFHHALALQSRAEARAEAELSIRRFEIEKRDSLERARMQHEAELERQRLFYKELTRGKEGNGTNPMQMMREIREMVSDEMAQIEERVAERGGTPSNGNASTTDAIMGAIKEAAPLVMPMITSAMGGGNGNAGGSSS